MIPATITIPPYLTVSGNGLNVRQEKKEKNHCRTEIFFINVSLAQVLLSEENPSASS